MASGTAVAGGRIAATTDGNVASTSDSADLSQLSVTDVLKKHNEPFDELYQLLAVGD